MWLSSWCGVGADTAGRSMPGSRRCPRDGVSVGGCGTSACSQCAPASLARLRAAYSRGCWLLGTPAAVSLRDREPGGADDQERDALELCGGEAGEDLVVAAHELDE